MPVTDILIVSGIVFAFVAFGVVLAWGERQTRNLNRDRSAPDAARHDDDLKKAA